MKNQSMEKRTEKFNRHGWQIHNHLSEQHALRH
jgi:hypothetical protein